MAEPDVSLEERFEASMVLSGVGDALGFKNGDWEFCHIGEAIHRQLDKLGGLEKIDVSVPKWRVSDDTVMHLATAEALVKCSEGNKDDLYHEVARRFKLCMNDMRGRSPGMTSSSGCDALRPGTPDGWQLPFDSHGGGCGAAMRAMCIGLRYPRPEDVDDLIAVSVESGRMTHHHPTGYLGALTAALFTAYAIQGKPVREWGAGLVALLPKVWQYVQEQGRYVQQNKENWGYFESHWQSYLTLRQIETGQTDPVFPSDYGVSERDTFYTSVSYSGWGGASGHDAPMIAYDATLGSGDSWEELCRRGMFHGGDSDSTGVMAAAWYGAKYGFAGVPILNHKCVEYRDRLTMCANELQRLSVITSEDNSKGGSDGTVERDDIAVDSPASIIDDRADIKENADAPTSS